MEKRVRNRWLIVAIIMAAVLADQALKLYIATHFALGESREVLHFFFLCFVENDGMAFGIEWFDKLFLTIFRLLAVGVLGWYMHRLVSRGCRTGYLAMIALTAAGALGNIIDCMFYGRLFGYAPFFYGKVVDMLYFPIVTDSAGDCLFFRPVFNIADSCITVAVISILIWFRRDLDDSLKKDADDS